MYRKLKIMATLFTFVVIGASFAPNAFAGPSGTCGGEVSNGLQLYNNWKHEGVVQEAVNKDLKSAGYHAVDGAVKPWMEEHVFKAQLAKTTTIQDWGCENGHMFKAGTRTLPKGEWVMGVFPTLSKSETLHKPHKGYKRTVAPMNVVGKVTCSNPFNEKTIGFTYKKVVKHHPRHHKCGCHKHHKKKPPAKGPICSQNSGNGISCGGGPCSNTTIIVGSGNTVNSSTECKTEESKKPCGCTPVPPEEPCGCTPPEESNIMITGKTELNMIPAGKTSGDFYINVNASKSGGTLTVDPGIGGVSSCSSTTPEDTITTSVPSGASKECVILYAPEDADNPSSMTVTMTACLGSVCDTKTETVPLTYPTRPQ